MIPERSPKYTQTIRIPDCVDREIKTHPFDNNFFISCCHSLAAKLNARPETTNVNFEFADRRKNLMTLSSHCEQTAGSSALMFLQLGRLNSENNLEETSPDELLAQSEKFAAAYAGTEGMFSEFSAPPTNQPTAARSLIGEFTVVASATGTEYKKPIHFRLEQDDAESLSRQKRSLCQLKSFLGEFGIAAKTCDTDNHRFFAVNSNLTLELQSKQEEKLVLGWLISRWAAAQINNGLEVTRKKLCAHLSEKSAEVSEAYGRPFYFQRSLAAA